MILYSRDLLLVPRIAYHNLTVVSLPFYWHTRVHNIFCLNSIQVVLEGFGKVNSFTRNPTSVWPLLPAFRCLALICRNSLDHACSRPTLHIHSKSENARETNKIYDAIK
ncbi:unnamed protein product [Rhizophagus irregularis]|nr:unnamed protein product [Rhizophagus irregularis]